MRISPWTALLLCGCSLANTVDERRMESALVEVCDDRKDNDGDGLEDCLDPNCKEEAHCAESGDLCCDNIDNDVNGVVDCAEPGCAEVSCCLESTEEACKDRIDNDLDGLIDCLEPGCRHFEYCSESTEEACKDRIDNDEDGRVDCQDESCWPLFTCFSSSPWQGEEHCGETRPPVVVADEFDTEPLDETVWDVFHSGIRDRPAIAYQTLDVNGRDGIETAGVASKTRFSVGSDQSFSLELVVKPEGPCHQSLCQLHLELHTRRQWLDLATDGGSVLRVSLIPTDEAYGMALEAAYHGEDLDLQPAPNLSFADGDSWTLRLATIPETGGVEVSVDGTPVVRTPTLLPAEPETRLVLHGSGLDLAGGGRMLVDRVALDVARGSRPKRCEGLRVSLFGDGGFCLEDRLDNGGLSAPKVVKTDAAFWPYHLFAQLHHGGEEGHRDVGHAVSNDGRKDWRWEPANEHVLGSHDWSDWAVGGLIYSTTRRRFEAWVRHKGQAEMWVTASAEPGAQPEPTAWTPQATVTLGDLAGLDTGVEPWIPEAVVATAEGYLGWFSAPDFEGQPAAWLARSSDGNTWTPHHGGPVLTAGETGAWDAGGLVAPSVTWNGSYYVMAYESGGFGVPASIGLAASANGENWLKHRGNPLVSGEEAGFDLDGAGQPTLLWDELEVEQAGEPQAGGEGEGEVEADVEHAIRLWYTAVTYSVRECNNNAPGTGRQRRIGLMELRLPHTLE